MDQDLIVGGAIAIDQNEIIDVGSEKELLKRYPHAETINHPNHVLMPGLINSHTHLDMGGHINYPLDPVRNMGINPQFIDWLLTCLQYKCDASSEVLREAVSQGIDDCIESGTTTIGDMGNFEGIFQCLEQKGLRAVIFPELLSFDSEVAFEIYETAMAIVEKYLDEDSDLISVGVGPYSPYTLSRNILKIMSGYCQSAGLPLAMHVSQSFSEVEFFYNSTGDIATHLFPNIGWGDNLPPAFHKTPIEYLKEIEFLTAKPILIGCVQATPKELDCIKKTGTKIIWTPRTNHYLNLGDFPLGKILDRDISISIATDGLSSNNSLSLWDEMRFAKKQADNFGVTLDGKKILEMVTMNAAHNLSLSEEVGSLSIGKKADYIVIKVNDKLNENNIHDELINQTKNYLVQKVVVSGETLKDFSA